MYPTFLWALSVLAIPLIIHLFNFRKTTRIYFSNNRFLKQVKEATTAKRKIKHLLILCARLLFLAFLVFTFAQPIVPATEQLDNTRYITLYVDNSLSMTGQIGDKTRGFDAAVTFAREVVNLFPPATRYKLITNDFAPFSNVYKAKAEILDLLTEIRLSPVSRSMEEVRDRIMLGNEHDHEVFWVSDFQKSTLGSPRLGLLDSTVRWHMVPIQFPAPSNIYVDTAYLENPFAIGGEKNVLHVALRNDGTKPADQLILKLTMNGIQVGTASVSIPASGAGEASFDIVPGLSGLNRATLNFNDFPVSFDNEFFLALNFSDKVRVLEIKSNDQPTPVQRVFGNQQVFGYRGFSISNFNYSLLSEADIAVVNGLDRIDPSLGLALNAYVADGGTLLLIPGGEPDLSSYQTALGLPGIGPVTASVSAQLDAPDFRNPFFENVFEEQSSSIAMPSAQPVMNIGTDRSAILKFKDQRAFLTLVQKTGKVYLMASPLQVAYTDFSNHALFVPVMYRLAASGKKATLRPYYTMEENFVTLTSDSLQGDEPLRLVGSEEIVPSQRRVGDRVFLDIPKFSITQGFYQIAHNGDTLGLLAFDLDKAESQLAQFTGQEIKTQVGGGDHISLFEAESTETFSNEIKARYLGRPLWKYALVMALAFLLAEVLLIRFLK